MRKTFSAFVFAAIFIALFLTGTPPSGALETGEVIEHTVVKGDTLWDISEKYLEDPFEWPELWRNNPEIRNPHLIYPGDLVRITPEGIEVLREGLPVIKLKRKKKVVKLQPPPVVIEEEEPEIYIEPEEEPAPVLVVPKFVSDMVAKSGFVTKGKLEHIGIILKGMDEKTYFHKGLEVFLSFKEPEKINIGDRFTVFENIGKVFHPETGKAIANTIERLGYIEVTRLDPAIEGMIFFTYKEMQAGAKLTPYEEPLKEIFKRTAANEVKGMVVSAMEGKTELAENDIIYINKGSEDGIEKGHTLQVYREREPMRDPLRPKKKKAVIPLPPIILGKAFVVRTNENFSTAYVLGTTLGGFLIGDLVRTGPEIN